MGACWRQVWVHILTLYFPSANVENHDYQNELPVIHLTAPTFLSLIFSIVSIKYIENLVSDIYFPERFLKRHIYVTQKC